MRLARRTDDVDGRRDDPVPLGFAEFDPEPFHAESVEVDGCAGVDQRAEQHVPGHAADAVDVGDHADLRAIRAAIVPAPNPSSMFTTATPAAHEVIIASRAETPPKVAP